MACSASALVSTMDLGVAIRSLDIIGCVCHPGSGSVVLSSAQRKTAILGDAAGSCISGRLLDRVVIFAWHLFPQLGEFQQNLWHAGSGGRTDGLAVLDGIRHADRSRAECGIGKEDKARSGGTA